MAFADSGAGNLGRRRPIVGLGLIELQQLVVSGFEHSLGQGVVFEQPFESLEGLEIQLNGYFSVVFYIGSAALRVTGSQGASA